MNDPPTNVEMYDFCRRDKARRRKVLDRLGKCCEREGAGGFCKYLIGTCPYVDLAFQVLKRTRGIK